MAQGRPRKKKDDLFRRAVSGLKPPKINYPPIGCNLLGATGKSGDKDTSPGTITLQQIITTRTRYLIKRTINRGALLLMISVSG